MVNGGKHAMALFVLARTMIQEPFLVMPIIAYDVLGFCEFSCVPLCVLEGHNTGAHKASDFKRALNPSKHAR